MYFGKGKTEERLIKVISLLKHSLNTFSIILGHVKDLKGDS